MLPLIARALDLRDVFERLSEVARRALPHDTCVVGIHSEDHTQVRLHALSGSASLGGLPEVVPNPYPKPLAVSREFAIIRDLASHPFERAGTGARLGLRSALRLPLSLIGRLKGVLDFSSFEVGRYSEADLPIARRIADYVTLAMSHKEIADEAQRAATLAERATSLNALEELLSTLTSVLDVRQVVDRVSEIAQTVLPHDAMSIPLLIEGADRVRVYANSGLGDAPTPYETAIPDLTLLTRPWEFQIFDDLLELAPSTFDRPIKAGMRSALLVPIKMGGQLRGALNFYSRAAARFTKDDAPIARRVADHIALSLSHQRLAEEAHEHEELRARTANLELLDGLLIALTDSGELPQLFDRISEIAKTVLPHDMLALPVLLPDGRHARVYANSGGTSPFPDVVDAPPVFATGRDWEFDLIDDLPQHPEQRNLTATKLGYRSALRVPIRLDDRLVAALAFLSFAPAAFKHTDILIARRVADRIALSLSREQRAAASQRADEASARVSRLESRVRELTDELDARTGYRRVIGESPQWREVLTQATQVGGDRHDRAAARRVGNRQGGRRAVPASRVGAKPGSVRRDQLRGDAREPARVGAVRLRARRVHRRDADQAGADRAGGRRRALPRRSRRDGAVRAGEVPARAAGAGIPAARRQPRAARGHPRHRRDQSRPPEGDGARHVPRGSVLPAERLPDQAAAAARSPRRHRAAQRSVHRRDRPVDRAAARRPLAGREAGADGIPLARQRARAAQRARARRDPVRRRADHRRPSRAHPGVRRGPAPARNPALNSRPRRRRRLPRPPSARGLRPGAI